MSSTHVRTGLAMIATLALATAAWSQAPPGANGSAVPAGLGSMAAALTTEQIKASEALAAKYDRSAARETARLQTFRDRPLGAAIQRSFDVNVNYLEMAAQMMPESGYGFRPTPDVRTFGEQILHAASSRYSFCNQAGMPPGVTRQAAPDSRGVTQKADIIKILAQSSAYCDRVLAAASEAWLMEVAPKLGGSSSGVIEAIRAHAFMYGNVHDAEDYGTITTYLRMQGVVPPSTARHPSGR